MEVKLKEKELKFCVAPGGEEPTPAEVAALEAVLS